MHIISKGFESGFESSPNGIRIRRIRIRIRIRTHACLVEQLKNLGPNAHKRLRAMLNNCFINNKIPTMWRPRIIAILKPGKDSSIPKSCRPISLLCHTYKLYERMILNRIAPTIEQHLIKEQAGFRAGKSCTSQLLNLTQHIEDGYQECKITGTAFVDLSAAYDTVNHGLLIQKL